MIEFRQKNFSGKFRLKGAAEWIKKKAEDLNPAMLAISSVGTGYGIANYNVNKKRKEADEELRKEQIEATKDLTKALERVEGLEKREAQRHSRNIKKAYKRLDPDDEHPYVAERAKKALFRKKGDK